MTTFLAGTITENIWDNQGIITNQYGFRDQLKKCWKSSPRILYIVSDPWAYGENDGALIYYRESFYRSGFEFSAFDLLDARYQHDFNFERLAQYDVILLGGGRVPLQHRFFEEIRLRQFFQRQKNKRDIVIIGISAGALNSAEETYNWPEEEGDSLAPSKDRFYQGLGLVKAQILPHFQARYDMYVDGRHLYNDITVEDSRHHEFIAIPDYSFVLAQDGRETIYGPHSYYRNGAFYNLFGQKEETA